MTGLAGAAPLSGLAEVPRRLFVLGATGRTGLPFVAQALSRGHQVTAYVRAPGRLPPELKGSSRLTVVTGQLADEPALAEAVRQAAPDACVSLLSSEAAPYTAVSAGTRGVLRALRHPSFARARPLPFASIASWGLGPSAPYIRGLFPKLVVGVARRTFWRKPYADFELQLSELEAARGEGLVRPMVVLPPMLGDGPTTGTYLAGDVEQMATVMGVTRVARRASIAELLLKLSERAAAGEEVPAWVALREAI